MTQKQWLQRHEASIVKHDKEIEAIRKLIKYGMKLLAETQKIQNENTRDIRELKNMMKGQFSNGHRKQQKSP